mgnify:CR=1 FL=1
MNVRELLAKVRKIEITTKRIVDDLTGGAYRSAFKGRGIEFTDVREYVPGDDVRDIDWNVTARADAPYVKKYAEEREMTVILAVDVSRSCALGSGMTAKRERMAETAALLALSAVRNHDKVGLYLFSERCELFLPPRSGKQHTLRVIREMLACEPEKKGTAIVPALQSLSLSLKKRAVIFLISDFAFPADYLHPLKFLSRKHDVVLLRVTDPMEHTMPVLPDLELSDAESGETLTFPGGFHNCAVFGLAAKYLAEQTEELARQAKTELIDLSTSEDNIAKTLMGFFRRRVRRGKSL